MILLYLPFLPLFFILPLLNSTPLFPFPPHRILPLCPALLNNSPLHPFLRLKPPFGTGGDPKNTHLTFPLHLNISISYYGCFVLPLLLLCRFPLPLGNGYFPISLLTKLPLSQSCMTDSSLFPSIFSPNFVINIKLSTPKTHARLVSLNSLPLNQFREGCRGNFHRSRGSFVSGGVCHGSVRSVRGSIFFVCRNDGDGRVEKIIIERFCLLGEKSIEGVDGGQ